MIRHAAPTDVAAVRALVERAYLHYVERIGHKPAPMLDDYAPRQRDGMLWVL